MAEREKARFGMARSKSRFSNLYLAFCTQAGLIEWVSDAASLGSLLGSVSDPAQYQQSLHGRYDPQGWTHKQCNELMNAAQNQKSVSAAIRNAQSRQAIAEIFANTQPVFRHYFFDRSFTAPEWFQRRLAYTRSVAASSIAGFVVGLGDRHTNNILLLEQTGEVVHIDLGIVFDQVLGPSSKIYFFAF
jgi:serine-protein kinase ATM